MQRLCSCVCANVILGSLYITHVTNRNLERWVDDKKKEKENVFACLFIFL